MQKVNGLALINGKASNKSNNPWYYGGVENGHVYLNHHSLPLSFFDNVEIGMSWLKLSSDDLNVEILFFNADEKFAVLHEYKLTVS